MRNAIYEMIKTVGRKLIGGSFNLTRISFPISGMCAKTSGETMMYGCKIPTPRDLRSHPT